MLRKKTYLYLNFYWVIFNGFYLLDIVFMFMNLK